MKKGFYILVIIILVGVIGYLVVTKNGQTPANILPSSSAESTPTQINSGDYKTYTFNQFHGEPVEGGGFTFQYPVSWHNNGQYFSPQKIHFYDLGSVDAPVYFDLINEELFSTSDVMYQITHDKKRSTETTVTIDNIGFKRFDLIDYGSSGGESTGQVIIYVGPKITFNGADYYLVFRWEEQPLTLGIPGNDPNIFDYMVKTLKFITK